MGNRLKSVFGGMVIFVEMFLFGASPAFACTVCYGANDSPLTYGMNMGILTLLIVIGFVFICFGSFFVYLWQKAYRFELNNQGLKEKGNNYGKFE